MLNFLSFYKNLDIFSLPSDHSTHTPRSLLTPFYVPAELRPNFSMQALLGRFRAALLDTDLVMRRHQAGEIRCAFLLFLSDCVEDE